ncbi:MAG: hypothetical protein B6I38_08480 [Anaerolineaceae bacterium 4572_5.1]|nr:MAG: hypothetical protein B6I38_08480 [Anaerolineaceae bacterium 4572_5.1]
MRTPAGIECPHFYGDYYRGRAREECRLLQSSDPPQDWKAELCKTCPVPSILRANSCENMRLNARVTRSFFDVFQRRVQVSAYCEKTSRVVEKPEIGCGECHPLPPIFEVKE